jgi:fucose 4-O-acetylase-like acetyltransferase
MIKLRVRNQFQKIIEFVRESFHIPVQSLAWINMARGFIIIMVVLRHSFEGVRNAGIDVTAYKYLETLNNLMYTFRMPLFFVISGILMNRSLKKIGLNQYILKRAQYILYPYLVWCVIQITLQLLLPQYVNNKASWLSYISILYNPRGLEQFWYLYALFNIMAIYSFCKVRLHVKPGLHFLIALVFFLAAQYADGKNIELYFINDILSHYIFFTAGDLASGLLFDKEYKEKLASPKTFIVILPFFAALHYYYLVHPEVNSSPFVLVIIFSGIVTALNLSFMLENAKRLKWIKVLGANSLYIFLMHVLIMAANRAFLLKVLHIESISFLLISNVVLGLVIPILAYYFLMKAGCWWLFSAVKPKKKEFAVSVGLKQVTP